MNNNKEEKYEDIIYNFRKKLYKEHKLNAIFFELTLRCNARCEHCGSSCGDKIPKDEITKEEIFKVLDDIANSKNNNPHNILLNMTGGEPLVRKDFFEITEYANKLGFYWGITTNGILIDEKVVKNMVRTNMYSISVSLDGLKETHEKFRRVNNCYDKILKGIKLMLKEPSIKVVQVTTCVNKKNIDELEDLYKLLLKIGVKNWRIIAVDPIGRARDNDDILLNGTEFKRMIKFMLDKKRENKMTITYGCGHYLGFNRDNMLRDTPFMCYAGVTVGCVLSNGDIFVCPDVKRRKDLIQGNIRKDNFAEVWEKKYKPYRKITRTSNSTCLKCKEWKLCCGDAFHTWDFDENKPLMCPKKLFVDDYKNLKEIEKLKKEKEKLLNKLKSKKTSSK